VLIDQRSTVSIVEQAGQLLLGFLAATVHSDGMEPSLAASVTFNIELDAPRGFAAPCDVASH
jgi:hypothetical protein